MWKFLYIAVCLFFVALLSSAGRDAPKASSTLRP